MAPDILCIGSVLWDTIGRSAAPLPHGADVPGRIERQPGGVACNVAVALARAGMRPALLSAVGRDAEGAALVAACEDLGLVTAHLCRSDRPTDRYMAIEDAAGLIAAIADVHALEAAGEAILEPLRDGRLGDAAAPWSGPAVLDGNLAAALMAGMADSPLLARADLRVVPASPDKARRLVPLLGRPGTTFYLNRAEAGILAGETFPDAATAARALTERGAARVLVTDGGRPCADARRGAGLVEADPPPVSPARVTGAGDAFVAAHIAAERGGAGRAAALDRALCAAAAHVTGALGP